MARARARAGALEGHVLEHVRHAVQLGRSRGGCRRRPRCRATPISTSGMRVDRHAQAIGESGDLDLAHGRTIRPRRGRVRRHAVVDQRLQRLDIVGQAVDALGAGHAGRRAAAAAGAARPSPSARHRETWPGWAVASTTIGTVGIATMLLRHGEAHGVCGSSVSPITLAAIGDRLERALVVEPARVEQLAHAAQRVGADLERAGLRGTSPSHRPRPCRRDRRDRTAGARSCSRSGCPCWGCRSARPRTWSWRRSRRSAAGCRWCWSRPRSASIGRPMRLAA